MDIYTIYNKKNIQNFNRFKRIKKRRWEFLVEGEWTKSMMASGNETFYYTLSLDGKYCFIKWKKQNKIIVICELNKDVKIEILLAKMLNQVYLDNGPYIEYPDNYYGDSSIDLNLFWEEYSKNEK